MNEAIGRFHLEGAVAQAKERNARRSAERVKQTIADAREGVAEFIVGRPYTAVACGLATGVLIGFLLPRPRIGGKVGALGGLLGKMVLDFGGEALKMAQRARHANWPGDDQAETVAGASAEADPDHRPMRKLLGRFTR